MKKHEEFCIILLIFVLLQVSCKTFYSIKYATNSERLKTTALIDLMLNQSLETSFAVSNNNHNNANSFQNISCSFSTFTHQCRYRNNIFFCKDTKKLFSKKTMEERELSHAKCVEIPQIKFNFDKNKWRTCYLLL